MFMSVKTQASANSIFYETTKLELSPLHINPSHFTYPIVWLTVCAPMEILQPSSSTIQG